MGRQGGGRDRLSSASGRRTTGPSTQGASPLFCGGRYDSAWGEGDTRCPHQHRDRRPRRRRAWSCGTSAARCLRPTMCRSARATTRTASWPPSRGVGDGRRFHRHRPRAHRRVRRQPCPTPAEGAARGTPNPSSAAGEPRSRSMRPGARPAPAPGAQSLNKVSARRWFGSTVERWPCTDTSTGFRTERCEVSLPSP